MREAAGHPRARLAERLRAAAPITVLVEGREALPRDRRLEGLGEHAERARSTSRRYGARRNASRHAPTDAAAPRPRLVPHAAVLARRSAGRCARSVVDRRGRSTRSRARAARTCRRRRPSARLARVDQPAVRRVQARTARARARPRRPRANVSKRTRARGAVLGPRLHAHPRLGDHAERALGAEQHPVGARAGARARAAAATPTRPRGVIARTDSTRSSMCVQTRREVPARARRDPAAERRELERLREVAQRQPVLRRAAPPARGPRRAAPGSRAARETASTSSTRSSAREVERQRRRCSAPGSRGSTPPTTLVPPPYGIDGDAGAGRPLEHAPRRRPRRAGARRSRARGRSARGTPRTTSR